MVAATLLDQAIVHPERRYRLNPNSPNRAAYEARMAEAAEAFGITSAEVPEPPPVPSTTPQADEQLFKVGQNRMPLSAFNPEWLPRGRS